MMVFCGKEAAVYSYMKKNVAVHRYKHTFHISMETLRMMEKKSLKAVCLLLMVSSSEERMQ